MKEARRLIIDRPIRFEVKTYIDDFRCGACVMGWLRPAGELVDNKTPHVCTHCKRVVMVEGDPYPRTVIVRQQITAGQ